MYAIAMATLHLASYISCILVLILHNCLSYQISIIALQCKNSYFFEQRIIKVPMVRSHRSSVLILDESERERMRHKFNLCYLMAKEGIAFEKCSGAIRARSSPWCQPWPHLQTAPSAKLFKHYIAESQRQQLSPRPSL